MTFPYRFSRLTAFLATGALIALMLILSIYNTTSTDEDKYGLGAVLWPQPSALNDFSLTENQKPFNLSSLEGKWTMLFFGYTHCPDVCPMTLTAMKAIYDGLAHYPDLQASTQVVFVSVDPARDTPALLAEYVAYFGEAFIGVTGAVDEIDNLTKQLHAGYIMHEPDENGAYEVDHASSIYLIGPGQRAHGAFLPPHQPEKVIAQYRKVRRRS